MLAKQKLAVYLKMSVRYDIMSVKKAIISLASPILKIISNTE